MSDDRGIYILLGLLMLVLPLSSLLARRPKASVVLRSLLTWAAIVTILYVAFANRARLSELAAGAGDRIGLSEQTVDGDTVRIRQSIDGHFWAQVRLNGIERRMLIDSGATSTAISESTAKAIRVTPRRMPPVILTTGNGQIEAARGRVETLRIGGLETRDLPVVIAPTFEDVEVIGMNFLSRLRGWRVEQGTLILDGKNTR